MEDVKFLEHDFELVNNDQDILKDEVLPVTPGWKDALKRFTKNKGAVFGIVCILIILVFAIFAPMVSSFEFDDINNSISSTKPNGTHLFGTDIHGRDLWTRVWIGTRYSLFVAVVAILIDVIVGMTYG
ncbi:MAG: ABC transporter permease, partial [Erysipelotrichia bacterium]|nr:ABC transporter permease [Erysipelotrichia bacterium]